MLFFSQWFTQKDFKRYLIETLMAILLLASYSLFSQSGNPCAMGDKYMERGKYAKAVKYYAQAAESHENKEACFKLGKCYANGLGVETDPSHAANWFYYSLSEESQEGLLELRKLSEARVPGALMWLGHCYQNGIIVPKNYDEAILLYKSLPNKPEFDLTELLDALEFMKSNSSDTTRGISDTTFRNAVMPEYPGGMTAFVNYLNQNIHYPEWAFSENIKGSVLVEFVIEKDGTVGNSVIVTSVHPLLDNEALRVINSQQKWTPGSKYGKPIRVYFRAPITFDIHP